MRVHTAHRGLNWGLQHWFEDRVRLGIFPPVHSVMSPVNVNTENEMD